jgi:hypothetical protein
MFVIPSMHKLTEAVPHFSLHISLGQLLHSPLPVLPDTGDLTIFLCALRCLLFCFIDLRFTTPSL